ncbi:hypothetical protein P7C73_g938, partial [Tremellales sp. Uapishka_1]
MSRRKEFDSSLSGPPGITIPASAQPASAKSQSVLRPTISSPLTSNAASFAPAGIAEDKDATSTPPSPEEVDDAVQCFICAEEITFWSVGVCGHRTCHICALRLRVFYKKSDCTFCKTPLPSVLFTRSPETPFPDGHRVKPSDPNRIAAAQANADKLEKGKNWREGLIFPGTLKLDDFEFYDSPTGVVFEDEDMMEETLLLLRYNCPYPNCAHVAHSWESLERHTASVHGLVICKLCRSVLSRFAHEQVLYPPHLLGLHDPSKVKRGQRPPRPRGKKEEELVESWDAPHPMCEFCHEAFFGPDELFSHMRGKHEECFVCKQSGEKDVYFQDYPRLEAHFHQSHFACMQPVCLEKKFVVFPNELDLRQHTLQEHGESMSSRDRAQARQLPISFSPYTEPSRSGRSGPPQAGPSTTISRNGLPHQQQITQTPLMNPAQAAQLRRQVQNDKQEENKRRKAFVTGLTNGSGNGNRNGHQEENASGFNTPREDVDEAVQARHDALLARVTLIVSDSTTKLSSFRSAVRQFRNNESGVRDMIDTLFNVFDRDVDATVAIVKEIAELFQGDEKKVAVLEAINAFRIEQREQFPTLGGGAPSYATDYAGVSSGKILKAKKGTQSGSRVWARVQDAAASVPHSRPAASAPATLGPNGRPVPGATSASAFPSLGTPSSSFAAAPTWSTGSSGPSRKPSVQTGPIIRSVNFPVATTKSKPLNTSAFPSLPPPSSSKNLTADQKKAMFKPTPREESIRRITGQAAGPPTTGNMWASGGVNEGVEGIKIDDEEQVEGKKKGKGKQKQLLFSVSARPM